jgi:hypothetical protein
MRSRSRAKGSEAPAEDGARRGLPPLYAPKLLEGKFSEVSMQDPAKTAISGAHRSLLRTSAPRGIKLHVAAVDGYALRWLIGRLLPVEPRAFEPLAQGKRDDRGP